ncbi:AI-2E family transporter [Candidatus Dojkabacteria bacterium]|nr:AI-2E family transporter [Candidatus Dojkabacteria bacterium]
MEAKVTKFEVSTRTLFKIAFFLIAIFFAWQLRGVFFMLFFAFILYSAFDPVVDRFTKLGVPRSVAILTIYIVFLVVLSFILAVGVSAMIDQYNNLTGDFDKILDSFLLKVEELFPWLQDQIDRNKIVEDLSLSQNLTNTEFTSGIISNAFGILSSVTTIILSVFVVLMVSIYMLDRQEKFYQPIIDYLPKKDQARAMKLMKKIETGLGSWFVGELLLMIAIGIVTWVVIMLPGMFFSSYTLDQYALPIALIAGLLEAVPNIGPTITSMIAVVIAIGSASLGGGDTTTVMALQSIYVVASGFLIQNLEAVFLVPKVMKRAVGVDPIVTILGIIAAFGMFGILGALLVIPMVATVQIAFNFFREEGVI